MVGDVAIGKSLLDQGFRIIAYGAICGCIQRRRATAPRRFKDKRTILSP